MKDGIEEDLIYVIVSQIYDGSVSTRAICTSKEEYEDYIKTHDTTGTRTMVINSNNPKLNKFGDIEEKIYNSGYYIVGYYDDVPLTQYEEEMMIESESSFHQHIKSKINDLKNVLSKEYIKFSKKEMAQIQAMMDIITEKNEACVDEEDIPEDDPANRINYAELLKHAKIL